MYKPVKGRAKITLAEGEGLYEGAIPELKIVDGDLSGTGMTFTDGKYAFFYRGIGETRDIRMVTDNKKEAEEMIRWMFGNAGLNR